MKKLRLQRADLFWFLAAGLIILLQFWWIPGTKSSPDDSYSKTITGQLGFYRILRQIYSNVDRESENLVPDSPCVAVLIAPNRLPTSDEEMQLFRFVSDGGTLIYAAPWSQNDGDLVKLKIWFEKLEYEPDLEPDPPKRSKPGEPNSDRVEIEFEDEEVPDILIATKEKDATRKLVPGSFKTRSAYILRSPNRSETLMETEDGTEIASWNLGDGRIIACASPEVFSNRSMLDESKSELAVRLIEYGLQLSRSFEGENRIVFCEYLNIAGNYQYSGILFSPSLRSATLQMILIALLIGWFGFHRFGPAKRVDDGSRRNLVESAQAIGNIVYRTRDGGSVVRNYLNYLKSRIRQVYGSLKLEDTKSLALRTGIPHEEVEDKLKRCLAQSRASGVPISDAAESVRWMAKLQQRLTNTKKSTAKKK